jgi:hypothetical protein
MAILDVFVVNVAAPSIEHDLGATAEQVQWVVARVDAGRGGDQRAARADPRRAGRARARRYFSRFLIQELESAAPAFTMPPWSTPA